MPQNNNDAERRRREQREDAQANAQRQHDANMQAAAQQHAIRMQQMQNAEAQKGRDFQKKQSAKDRASQFASQNTKKQMDMSADHTGGARQYGQNFGQNTYKGKGFQQYDFSKK